MAQNQIFTGQIIDAETKEPIPYATLLIKNTIYGVQSDQQGQYILELPVGYENDSISVKSLSYLEKVFAVRQMNKQKTIQLKLNSQLLDEVIIYPVNPDEILKLATENYNKNHKTTHSDVQQCFTRELFFEKGKCLRIGESIVDIYNLKLPNDSILRNVKKIVAARAIQDSAKLWLLNDIFRLKHDTISFDESFSKDVATGLDIISFLIDTGETQKEKKKESGLSIGMNLNRDLKYNGTIQYKGRTSHRILLQLTHKKKTIFKGKVLIDSATYAFSEVQIANQNIDLFREFVPWYMRGVIRLFGYKPVFNSMSLASYYTIGKDKKWYESYNYIRLGGSITKRKETLDGYVQTESFYLPPQPFTQKLNKFSTQNKGFKEAQVTSFSDTTFWRPRKGIATPPKVQEYAKIIHNNNQQFEGSIGYNKKESRKRRREIRRKRR